MGRITKQSPMKFESHIAAVFKSCNYTTYGLFCPVL